MNADCPYRYLMRNVAHIEFSWFWLQSRLCTLCDKKIWLKIVILDKDVSNNLYHIWNTFLFPGNVTNPSYSFTSHIPEYKISNGMLYDLLNFKNGTWKPDKHTSWGPWLGPLHNTWKIKSCNFCYRISWHLPCNESINQLWTLFNVCFIQESPLFFLTCWADQNSHD